MYLIFSAVAIYIYYQCCVDITTPLCRAYTDNYTMYIRAMLLSFSKALVLGTPTAPGNSTATPPAPGSHVTPSAPSETSDAGVADEALEPVLGLMFNNAGSIVAVVFGSILVLLSIGLLGWCALGQVVPGGRRDGWRTVPGKRSAS
ncbi:hypothetical protein F4861DRAFT_485574 [Xylaria intraflava]|nr:hypothetical protein F4861DRAFT_485574 [Xylaria intraflava]